MNKFLIVAYDLSAAGNHGYFFDDAPDSIFCEKCGCCMDSSYLPTNFKVSNRMDLGATYDRRFIASLGFKEYIESLLFDVEFLPIDQKGKLFLMKPKSIIDFVAYKKSNYCDSCHQYFDQVMPDPSFYDKTGNILEEGIFFTSTSFGSGKEKSPEIILGIKTAKIIAEAVKTFKFRGVDIIPIEVKVD